MKLPCIHHKRLLKWTWKTNFGYGIMALQTHVLNQPSYALSALKTLIQAPSITPNDAGLLDWLSSELGLMGFEIIRLPLNGVDNLIAVRHFLPGPVFAFAGHVDVVPAAGSAWKAAPFSADIIEGAVYGRGACDMKGGIAAMLSACQKLVNLHELSPLRGSFYWLITSDEEGEAEFGSKYLAQYLAENNITLDACLVGEPTSELRVGDAIKNGRRGAISARIQVRGKAGHVAYPQNTINAAHLAGQIVNALSSLPWENDQPGSATTLQVTGINIPNVVDNLVPAKCEITFNIRYSHGYNSEEVIACIERCLSAWSHAFELAWERPCESYYTGEQGAGCFLGLIEHAIFKCTGQYPQLSTAGGTSDGRFFSNSHTQVIEVGVRNHTIHQVNEHLPLADLDTIELILFRNSTRLF